MRLFAVSDLHIEGPDDPLYRNLLKWIHDHPRNGDTLVFVGDLFDLFIGTTKLFSERYHAFIDELKAASNRGVQIHYLEGNHDFLLNKIFETVSNVRIYTGDFDCSLGGKRFLFSHGDLANPKDFSYRILKKFYRSPLMRAFYKWAPGRFVDEFGKSNSKISRARKPLLPQDLPAPKLEVLRTTYRNFAVEQIEAGYDFVIMGHCHDLDEMSFKLGDRVGQYINVGYPRVHGTFLYWEPELNQIERKNFFNSTDIN
jgi:UDP-2,3-diacylglucosamine hydrolase